MYGNSIRKDVGTFSLSATALENNMRMNSWEEQVKSSTSCSETSCNAYVQVWCVLETKVSKQLTFESSGSDSWNLLMCVLFESYEEYYVQSKCEIFLILLIGWNQNLKHFMWGSSFPFKIQEKHIKEWKICK